jgi:hypothetical protein
MLASRLQTNMGVFGLTAFAVEWFALFPIFRRHLQVNICSRLMTGGTWPDLTLINDLFYFGTEHDASRAFSSFDYNVVYFHCIIH